MRIPARTLVAALLAALALSACSSHPKMTCAEADQALVESLPDHIDWSPAEEEGVDQATRINEEACK